MVIKYREHAVKRMIERKITTDEVVQIISFADGKIQQSNDKWIYYKKFLHRTDNLVAAVILDIKDQTFEIITIMINFEVQL